MKQAREDRSKQDRTEQNKKRKKLTGYGNMKEFGQDWESKSTKSGSKESSTEMGRKTETMVNQGWVQKG